jgi:quercetin dioxygenase-like cupin family protein
MALPFLSVKNPVLCAVAFCGYAAIRGHQLRWWMLTHPIERKSCMDQQHFIKNIEFSKVVEFAALVDYQEGQVVSRTLSQGKACSVTLFAFDKGEEISSHASTGDAMAYILDGASEITIADKKYFIKKGETIVMPAETPHALLATERFKMLLIVVFGVG